MQPLTSKLPEPKCPQGVNSKTFTPVPPNPLLTILDIYDWHHQHSSQHPFFVYPDDSSDTNTSTILWGDAVQAVYRIAHSVLASMTAGIGDERPLVGLCLTTDNLTYMLSIIGAMRTGLPVILISDCLSPATMDHIISTSGVSHIVLNKDDSRVCSLITDSISRTQQMRPDLSITTSFIPTFNDLFPGDGSKIDPPNVKPYDLDSTAFILHSSGSTAFPKLASWTYKMISVTPLWQTWYGEKDICGHIMSTPSIPMAGAVGAMQTLLTASSGLIISGFKPTSPAIVANAENTWQTMVDTKATYGLIFQPYLCAWAQDPEKVKVLSKLDGVLFAGGPLPKVFGDKLFQAGVNLFLWFGSFEDGELLGLIVDVSPAYLAENDVTTDEGAANFKEKIWPTVQRYNAIVPVPAILTKEASEMSL
ncbi:hypothetical protein BDQ12DRAFT_720371 [Crucibulum laeve]|uniref:AMP-dependent synthetase/ligase domain-containing protein n=1 Tax=Crucibulum laeve TaxID=68775 RepID=A0A5C3MCF4_9AGAR|nr:hypothetical protein BDQ12DRAFT_720371 [Crucibulum laeve]